MHKFFSIFIFSFLSIHNKRRNTHTWTKTVVLNKHRSLSLFFQSAFTIASSSSTHTHTFITFDPGAKALLGRALVVVPALTVPMAQ